MPVFSLPLYVSNIFVQAKIIALEGGESQGKYPKHSN